MKVLHVYPQLNCGGTEMVIYNLIKYSEKERFHYDVLVQKKGEMDSAFEELGCEIVVVPKGDSRSYESLLKDTLRESSYEVIHTHMHEDIPIVLKVAKEMGIQHRIVHSHNARIDIPRILWPLRFFKHCKYERCATRFFGCSELALKWLFPRKWRRGTVIYNGIDLEAFKYNAIARKESRAKLGVQDNTKVVVNVGRCTEQKNHNFILNRAKELSGENILFVIIGEGPLLESLQERIAKENITNVRMLGKRFDIPQLLCAADIFLFPSIYEGLGIVAIEAQANGLPVLSTDSIPMEADMQMGIFHRISLKNIEEWNRLLGCTNLSLSVRTQKSEDAINSKYNIRTVVKELEDIYMS